MTTGGIQTRVSIHGVIFDFDGVIADTETLHLHAYQETVVRVDLSLTREAYYERYLGYDDIGVFTTLASDQGVTLEPHQLAQLVTVKGQQLAALRGAQDVLFPGAAECIRRLASTTTLGIASGALHAEIDEILTEGKLSQYFSVVVGADDVERTKPAPDAYQTAVRVVAGTAAPDWRRYVAIEDSPWGLEAARAAGLRRIGITNSYPAATLSDAEIVVGSLSEVDHRLLEILSDE